MTATPTAPPPDATIDGKLLLGSLAGQVERYFVVAEGEARQFFEAEGCNPCVSVSRDGRLAAHPWIAPGDKFATAVYDVTSGETAELPPPEPLTALGPGPFSPRGDRLLRHGSSDDDPSLNGLYTTRVDGSDLKLVAAIRDDRGRDPMAWSADGKSLLVFSEDASRTAARHLGDVYVLPAAGGEARPLNPEATSVSAIIRFGTAASFSPDGNLVAFAAMKTDDPGQSALFVAETVGGSATRITDWGRGTTTALWSPTDDWILFDRRFDNGYGISIVRPDGSDERVLWGAEGEGTACCATWSPDGSRLLFQRGPDGGREFWVMDVDGNVEGRVDVDPGTWIWYHWIPAG